MAYQAKRHKHFVEQFELVDERGCVAHSLKVELDPGVVAENLSRKHAELLKASKEVSNIDLNNPETVLHAYEKLGNAAIDMIEAVFGEENAGVIMAFYGKQYNDMITEVIPFINGVVIPEVRKMAQDNRKNALRKYNRKQRRALQKRYK